MRYVIPCWALALAGCALSHALPDDTPDRPDAPDPDDECPAPAVRFVAPLADIPPWHLESERLEDAMTMERTLVVLAHDGHRSMMGLLFVELDTGAITWSELWRPNDPGEGSARALAGGRLLVLGDEIGAVLPVRQLDRVTGTTTASVELARWSRDGTLRETRVLDELSVDAPRVEGWDDGVGVAVGDDRAAVSFVVDDTAWILALSRTVAGLQSEGWSAHGPLSTGLPAALPSSLALDGTSLVLAGGGVPPRSPRAPLSVRLGAGEPEPIAVAGTRFDPPPRVLGTAMIARPITDPAEGGLLVLSRLGPDARELRIRTRNAPPPVHLALAGASTLIFSTPSPSHPRAVDVRAHPLRFGDGATEEASAPVLRIPDGVDSPSIPVAAGPDGEIHLVALSRNPPRTPSTLVVASIPACATR